MHGRGLEVRPAGTPDRVRELQGLVEDLGLVRCAPSARDDRVGAVIIDGDHALLDEGASALGHDQVGCDDPRSSRSSGASAAHQRATAPMPHAVHREPAGYA